RERTVSAAWQADGIARRLIAGVGYRNLRDMSLGPVLIDGIGREQAAALQPLPHEIVARVTDVSGQSELVLTQPPTGVVRRHGMAGADGVTLLLMGCVEHAGAG